jgi:hypothetical protein
MACIATTSTSLKLPLLLLLLPLPLSSKTNSMCSTDMNDGFTFLELFSVESVNQSRPRKMLDY